MKKRVCFVLICLLMSAVLAACSPSQAERDVQATEIAAENSANQTAEAPTSTPTLTPTSTPTPTPTLTPTLAPTLTVVPSMLADWREHSTSGYHIALPDHWEVVDVGEEGIETILDSLEGTNAEWAQNITTMFSAKAMRDMTEFWAMDPEPAGIGYATVYITYQSQPFPLTIDVLCALMPSMFEPMGIELVHTECGLTVNDLDAARFLTSLPTDSMNLKQYQYAYVREGNIWTLALTVDETEWSEYEPTFAAIAESFRVD